MGMAEEVMMGDLPPAIAVPVIRRVPGTLLAGRLTRSATGTRAPSSAP
jgi:hypothetical protein